MSKGPQGSFFICVENVSTPQDLHPTKLGMLAHMHKLPTALLLSIALATACLAAEAPTDPPHFLAPRATTNATVYQARPYTTVLYLAATAQDGDQVATALQNLGIACATCAPDQSPAALTTWLKQHLTQLGGDPDRIYWICARPTDLNASKNAAGVIWIADQAFGTEPNIPAAQRFQLIAATDSLPLQTAHTWKNLDHTKLGADAPITELPTLTTDDLSRTDSPLQLAVRKTLARWNPQPPLGLKGVKYIASPNWSMRPAHETIDTIVVHATVINTMEGTIRAFMDDKVRKVSAHYCIDRDGSIIQMVDENLIAHHAGVSELQGKPSVNGFSIGFELINKNDGTDPYPDAQYQALAKVIRDIRTRWNVPDSRIVSHEHIARPIGRKSDPKGFDFSKLLKLLNDPR